MADSSMDLQLMGTDINVIDPITKTRMTNPVRNAMCGHVYDKESLIALLRKNNKTRYVFYRMIDIAMYHTVQL